MTLYTGDPTYRIKSDNPPWIDEKELAFQKELATYLLVVGPLLMVIGWVLQSFHKEPYDSRAVILGFIGFTIGLCADIYVHSRTSKVKLFPETIKFEILAKSVWHVIEVQVMLPKKFRRYEVLEQLKQATIPHFYTTLENHDTTPNSIWLENDLNQGMGRIQDELEIPVMSAKVISSYLHKGTPKQKETGAPEIWT